MIYQWSSIIIFNQIYKLDLLHGMKRQASAHGTLGPMDIDGLWSAQEVSRTPQVVPEGATPKVPQWALKITSW